MNETIVVSAGVLAMITLEVIKLLVRKYWVKNATYDFPPIFYTTTIPFFTALWSIGLAYAGWGEPVTYTFQTLVQWFVSIIVTLAAYNLGIAPQKKYAKDYKFKNL